MNPSKTMANCVGFRGSKVKTEKQAMRDAQNAKISRIYSGFGVRVKMVHRSDDQSPRKIPTVQELIDKLMNKQHVLDLDGRSSATTPSGHLSQSDFIQSLDGRNEEYRSSTDSALDSSRRSKGRYERQDLDRRPPSQNGIKNIQLANGRVPPPILDGTSREFDRVQLQSSPDDKQRKGSYFKPNGLRSAFNEKLSLGHSGKDDLVATGTIMNSVTSSRQMSKSLNLGNGHSTNSSAAFGSSSSRTGGRLSFQRPPQSQMNFPSHKQKQPSEPKYADPLNGSDVSFQQRLAELATLEADTVRWERNRKVKKKNKDKDS